MDEEDPLILMIVEARAMEYLRLKRLREEYREVLAITDQTQRLISAYETVLRYASDA